MKLRLISFFILTFLPLISSAQYFVSPKGNDSGNGSIKAPFATLEHALEVGGQVVTIDTLVVNLLPGVYHQTKSVILGQGLYDRPVKIIAPEGEVVFHGGVYLNGNDFKPLNDKNIENRLLPEAKGKLYVFDLKKAGINDYGQLKQHGFGTNPSPTVMELFIDGTPQTLARYPNDDKRLAIGKIYDVGSIPRWGDRSNRGGEFGFEYDRPQRWKNATDIWLHGKFSAGYNDDHLRVEKINFDKSSFKIEQPHLYGLKTSTMAYVQDSDKPGLSVRGYYAYNLLEEIDSIGEYYIDRTSGKLYVYPGTDLSKAKIEVSLLEDPFISVFNRKNVQIENVKFTCSRGLGIYLNNSSDITIDNCHFSNLGTVAVSLGQAYASEKLTYNSDGSPNMGLPEEGTITNITIQNCLIKNTGTGGILLSGGDRKTLSPSNNLVYNCEFDNTDRINQSYSPSIKIYGVGSTVRNSYFHDIHHQAISFTGNDHVIEYSEFERVCTDADDMGAIYTGRNPSARGTEIRYNLFKDIQPDDPETSMTGVYIDDGSGGMTIRNNFFYKVGNPGHYKNFAAIFYHGSHQMKAFQNTFLDCEVAIGQSAWDDERWDKFINGEMIQGKAREEVDILSEVYQERYPELKDYFEEPGRRMNWVDNNLTINTELVRGGDFMLRNNNSMKSEAASPNQVDYSKVDQLFKVFEPFPFDKVGLINIPNE